MAISESLNIYFPINLIFSFSQKIFNKSIYKYIYSLVAVIDLYDCTIPLVWERVSQKDIAKIELGKSKPRIDFMSKLSLFKS